jgi:hypothetical protein
VKKDRSQSLMAGWLAKQEPSKRKLKEEEDENEPSVKEEVD